MGFIIFLPIEKLIAIEHIPLTSLTLAYEDEFSDNVRKLGYMISYSIPNQEALVWNRSDGSHVGKEIYEFMRSHGWAFDRAFYDKGKMKVCMKFDLTGRLPIV